MKREFSASKLAWALVILLQTAALGVAMMSLVFEQRWSVVAVAAGLVVSILSAALKLYAGRRYDRGERLRRLLMRSDGIGQPISNSDRLATSLDPARMPSWDPDPIGSYYTSPKPAGPSRLAHIAAQSAFFTAKHAGTAKAWCLFAVLLGGCGGVALLFALVLFGGNSMVLGPKVAQAASTLIAFGFAGEFLQLKAAYADLECAATRALERCCQLSKEPAPDAALVFSAVGEYECTLAKSPPIPGLVYRVQRSDLEAEWLAIEARSAQSQP